MSEKKEKKQSAQARKKEIAEIFGAFCTERDICEDWEKYVTSTGDKLNRSEIAKELGFARDAWRTNDLLKEKLLTKEKALRNKDILTQVKEKDTKSLKAESDRKDRSLGQSQSRVKSLEQQLAAVSAERDDLKRRVDRLEFLEYHMTTTGRVPH